MRTRISPLVLGSLAAAALVASPVAAGTAQPVTITLHVDFEAGTEEFTATGAFCPTGSAETTDNYRTGGPTGVFHVDKTFTCDDGSGTLSISLDAVFQNNKGGTIGGWRIVGGTDDYAGALGGGQIVGVGTNVGIDDTYSGLIR
jgi:hypothetical protein